MCRMSNKPLPEHNAFLPRLWRKKTPKISDRERARDVIIVESEVSNCGLFCASGLPKNSREQPLVRFSSSTFYAGRNQTTQGHNTREDDDRSFRGWR